MRPERGRSPFQTLLAGAASLVVLALAIAGVRSYHDLVAVKTREAEIQRRIQAADERIEALGREIERLRDDPATLERHAREDLGLVKPGDVVVLLPEEGAEGGEDAEGAPAADGTSGPPGRRDGPGGAR